MASKASSAEIVYHAPSDDMWRRYGEERRRKLIKEDENVGGTAFTINKSCELQRYLDLAERVTSQFRILCDNMTNHVEEAYVMGHRLLRFLQTALPEHPDFTPESGRQCREDAAWLSDKPQKIALQIDEEQLNLFMDQNFDPLEDDDSHSSDDEEGWEKFTDWAFKDSSSAPRLVDTDTSEQASSESETETEEPCPQHLFLFDIEQDNFLETSFEEPHYTLNEPVVASNFLKQIANEDVRYEWDSEAADSWAQDGSAVLSGASSGTALTYDPARIAFRELMSKDARELEFQRKEDQSSPSGVVAFERKRYPGKLNESPSDEWPSFDLEYAMDSIFWTQSER